MTEPNLGSGKHRLIADLSTADADRLIHQLHDVVADQVQAYGREYALYQDLQAQADAQARILQTHEQNVIALARFLAQVNPQVHDDWEHNVRDRLAKFRSDP